MARCSHNGCRRWRPSTAIRALGLGLRVDSAWFCSDRCVAAVAEQRLRDIGARITETQVPPQRLGQILTQQRKITGSELVKALESQRASGRRLGRELLHLGLITREALLGALSAQTGTRYLTTIDTASVRTAPGQLSADEVRALGVVPFGDSNGRLLVAFAAPVPNAALDAMAVLIGRPIDPFLVDDDDLVRLQAAYGAQAVPTVATWMVKDAADGAERIAEAAAKAGAVDVKEARVDPYTWVRIEANGRVSTLLVPPSPASSEEDPWPAATTRH